MKPGNLQRHSFLQGAKSGGSVSKDEGTRHPHAPPLRGVFLPSNQRQKKGIYYGKKIVYL